MAARRCLQRAKNLRPLAAAPGIRADCAMTKLLCAGEAITMTTATIAARRRRRNVSASRPSAAGYSTRADCAPMERLPAGERTRTVRLSRLRTSPFAPSVADAATHAASAQTVQQSAGVLTGMVRLRHRLVSDLWTSAPVREAPAPCARMEVPSAGARVTRSCPRPPRRIGRSLRPCPARSRFSRPSVVATITPVRSAWMASPRTPPRRSPSAIKIIAAINANPAPE